MGKGIMAIHNEIRKKEHRASRLGQIEATLHKFYGDKANSKFFEEVDGKQNPNVKWLDIHRATTISKQNTLEEEFSKEYESLIQKYKALTDDLLATSMEQEHDYLTKLTHGN